jgi:regulator of sigma E protease
MPDQILNILQMTLNVLFIVFFFGFCIFIHEFGHLLAAIWRGMHVEKFSVGFGKAIYTWRYKDVDYMISWLPFGGYVALPQLEPTDEPQSSDGKPLPPVKPMDRIIVAFAGPLFNVLFGLFLGLFIWHFGVLAPEPVPHVDVGTIVEEYKAEDGTMQPTPESVHLQTGDRILSVNGKPVERGWRHFIDLIVYDTDATLQIIREGEQQEVKYGLAKNPEREGLRFPFFDPLQPTVVAEVLPLSAARASGLKQGDVITHLNGEEITHPGYLINSLQDNKDAAATISVLREKKDGSEESLEFTGVVPKAVEGTSDGKPATVYQLGVKLAGAKLMRFHPTPWKQFTDVVSRMYRTLAGVKKGAVSGRHFSGPVGIFHMLLKVIMAEGFMPGLQLIILVSFSLAIINLFPLPVLDGGHITMAVIEIITRRQIPTNVAMSLQYAFAICIISFMMFVTYFDIQRVFKDLF